MPLDFIITRSNLLLSKNSKHWQEWQNEYEDYMTSLTFENLEELLAYLQIVYKLSDLDIENISDDILKDAREIIEVKLPTINK